MASTFHFPTPRAWLLPSNSKLFRLSTRERERERERKVCINVCAYKYSDWVLSVYLHASGHPSKRRAAPHGATRRTILLKLCWRCFELVYQKPLLLFFLSFFTTLNAGVNHSGASSSSSSSSSLGPHHFIGHFPPYVYYFIILDLFSLRVLLKFHLSIAPPFFLSFFHFYSDCSVSKTHPAKHMIALLFVSRVGGRIEVGRN